MSEPAKIGAIETRYRGLLYRSRTEARWSCFFTTLGLKYQYEPQGFLIDYRTPYLPDFFLPEVRYWAEVKPVEFSPEERRKLEGVADQTKRPGLLLVGHPGFHTYEAVYPRDIDIADAIYSPVLLDIHGWYSAPQFRKGRLFNEARGWWTDPDHFSGTYRHAVFEALTNRFVEGGRW